MTEYTTVSIGIAKDTFDVYINSTRQLLHLNNTPEDHQQLLSSLSAIVLKFVVIEATGRYHSLLTAPLELAVASSRQVKNFARALDTLYKTAPNDARAIYEFSRRMELEARPPPDEQTQCLAGMVTRRRQLVEDGDKPL
ncbi:MULTISPECIES: IS110 family transposase [unclassified Serratia (in: enterobacteria)]|uniref:IS110 family transposase n=1 Tax=unclassified Serratia (in: enterobacteria) TaxID=2647522 RepID=UPI0004681D0F|nr:MULTISPECIES: IS110 family transposase [unclassified Serratia (in: enterobacteria)]